MNKLLPVFALAALWMSVARDAHAYGSGQFNNNLTRCDTCHTNGDAPTLKLTPTARAAKVGAGFQITAGTPASLVLEVKTRPGKGLGFAIAADAGLTLESTREDTRVDRQILGHARVLFVPDGKYRIEFRVLAPATSCGRRLRLRASVLAANRDGAPSGDGAAAAIFPITVNCPAGKAKARPAG
jgi:hypothetical protein